MLNCTFIDVSQFVAEPLRTGVQRVLIKLIEHLPPDAPVIPFRVLDRGRVGIIDPLLFGFMTRFFHKQTPTRRSVVASDHGLPPGAPAEELIIRHIASNPLAVMSADRFFRRAACIINLESFSDPERSRFYIGCGKIYRHKISHFIHDFLLFEAPGAFPQLNWRYGLDHILLLEAYSAGGRFFVATPAMADKVCRYLNRPTNDVLVARFGGDLAPPERIAALRKPRTERRRRVVSLGTIEPRKFPAVVVRALDALAARHRDLDVIVIGSWGWVTPATRAEIASIFAAGRIQHRPRLADDEMITLLANTDAAIYVSSAEGFGLPVIEFAALGVPVITNRAVPAAALVGAGATVLDDVTEEALTEAVEAVLTAGEAMVPYYRTTWTDCARTIMGSADPDASEPGSGLDILSCWRGSITLVRELRHDALDWDGLKRRVRSRLVGQSGSNGLLGATGATLTDTQIAETTEIISEIVSDNRNLVYWADLTDTQTLLAEVARCMATETGSLDGLMRAYVAFLGRQIDTSAAQDATRIETPAQRFHLIMDLIHSGEARQFLGHQRGIALHKVMDDVRAIVAAAMETPIDLLELFERLEIAPARLDDITLCQELLRSGTDRLELLLFFAQRRRIRGDSLDLFLESVARVVLERGSRIASSRIESKPVGEDETVVNIAASRSGLVESERTQGFTRVLAPDSVWLTDGWHLTELVGSNRFRWMGKAGVIVNPEVTRPVLELRLDVESVYGATEPLLLAHFDEATTRVELKEKPRGWLVTLSLDSDGAAPVEGFYLESLVTGCPARDEGKSDSRELSLCLLGATIVYAD